MVTVEQAPAIRTRRKARCSEGDEARALIRAMRIWARTPVWIPVCFRGKILGEIRGSYDGSHTAFVPAIEATGFPFKNYDDAINNNSLEQRWSTMWWKPNSTSLVIDNWYDAWGTDGSPQRGDWSGTAKTARQFTNLTAGAMYHGGPVSTKLKYVTRTSFMTPEDSIHSLILYDRVLSYDACTMTAGTQTMTNTLAATRYISGGDPGLQLFIEADTVHSATAANLTGVSYTNNLGTAGQVINLSQTLAKIVSVAAPTITLAARSVIQAPGLSTQSILYVPLSPSSTGPPLPADLGMRSIQSYTWSAAPTGTCSFVLQFPLMLFSDAVNTGQVSDYEFLMGTEAISKRIYDDACLSILYAVHTTAKPTIYQGWSEFSWT